MKVSWDVLAADTKAILNLRRARLGISSSLNVSSICCSNQIFFFLYLYPQQHCSGSRLGVELVLDSKGMTSPPKKCPPWFDKSYFWVNISGFILRPNGSVRTQDYSKLVPSLLSSSNSVALHFVTYRKQSFMFISRATNSAAASLSNNLTVSSVSSSPVQRVQDCTLAFVRSVTLIQDKEEKVLHVASTYKQIFSPSLS